MVKAHLGFGDKKIFIDDTLAGCFFVCYRNATDKPSDSNNRVIELLIAMVVTRLRALIRMSLFSIRSSRYNVISDKLKTSVITLFQ